ncbi:hypothetical protein RLDS_00920 [Sphingobium lactosutens DS20]|uniref:Uncharacterized protein n=1 Tax=Sphingobium lactosutens DS20 TaxID=1331060 RepID=T0J4K1_9SPHN|nr:hypothetical protein RLDS_00920 [Sphingobium lactosutens DS20]
MEKRAERACTGARAGQASRQEEGLGGQDREEMIAVS